MQWMHAVRSRRGRRLNRAGVGSLSNSSTRQRQHVRGARRRAIAPATEGGEQRRGSLFVGRCFTGRMCMWLRYSISISLAPRTQYGRRRRRLRGSAGGAARIGDNSSGAAGYGHNAGSPEQLEQGCSSIGGTHVACARQRRSVVVLLWLPIINPNNRPRCANNEIEPMRSVPRRTA